MNTFGIISEGPTDQIIIENILVGYFDDPDLSRNIRPLQPLNDATDNRGFGGWVNVFEYCKSDYFVEALEQNNYLVIQIDTDCCEEINFDVKKTKPSGERLTTEELVNAVITRFESVLATQFGDEYQLFKHRILFAISVEEIECWLLPLYHDDKVREATNNCVHKLNPKLTAQFGRFIDKSNKSTSLPHYGKFSRPFIKRKNIDKIYHHNVSLKLFLDSLGKIKND